MLELTDEPPLTGDDPRWFAQMVTVNLGACDADALKSRLWDEYRIEVPVGARRGTSLRVSAQGYTTRADIERLLEALRTLLPQLRSTPFGRPLPFPARQRARLHPRTVARSGHPGAWSC